MTTLILCIDRDNDIGEKAGISTPIIGREANIQAALSLGLSDPEDSDVNSIFAAVKLYDRLKSEGEDIEIVTVAGDKRVGVESDMRIMEQLKGLIVHLHATKAILVSDGAEDEALLSILQKKIDIIGVERVTVKQERKIEGIYYFVQKAIEDEKMRKIVIPLSLILMAWGISLFLGMEGMLKGFIVFIIGAYLMLKTYHLEGEVNKIYSDIVKQIKEGKLSWVFSSISLIFFILGFFKSIDDLRNSDYYLSQGTSMFDISFFIYILIVFESLVFWIVFSLLVREFGKLVDVLIHTATDEEKEEETMDPGYHLNVFLFLISTGLFFKSGLDIVIFIADQKAINFSATNTMGMIILGIALFFAGRYLSKLGIESPLEEKKKRHFLFSKKEKTAGWRH